MSVQEPVAPSTSTMPEDVQRGRELLGLPFYSIREGKLLGSVDGLLVRRSDLSIPLLRMRSGGLSRPFYVPFTALQVLGPDVVLTETQANILQDIPATDIAGLDTDLPGRPILTRGGENIGKIEGFGMDTATGHIAFLRVKTHAGFLSRVASLVRDSTVQVSHTQIQSIGPDAVILTDEGALHFHTAEPAATVATPTT